MPAPDHPPSTVLDPPSSWWETLSRIGPGLILAGAIVGTGELIATTNLGAKAGFALLWLVIVSCFIKVFVQIELGRHAITTGDGTFQGFKKLPGPGIALVWWCGLMILFTQMQIGAMIGGVAQAIDMATPGVGAAILSPIGRPDTPLGSYVLANPELPWALLVTAVTIALLATGSYRLVERGTALLVVTFTFMTIFCVIGLPAEHRITWAQLTAGLTPRLSMPREVVVAAFTMFGITGVGASELLAYPYWCLEKGYGRHVGPRDDSAAWLNRATGWLRVLRLDAWVCMVIYTIATLSFYLLGASVMHRNTGGKGLPGDQILPELARMYAPTLGPGLARVFIVVGSFAVLYSTLFAATAGNARLLTEFLRANRLIDPDREDLRLRWVRFSCTALLLVSLALYLVYRNPVLMVTVGGLMQAISLPFIGGAAVYLRYRRSDRRLTPGLAWDVLLWLSLLGLTLAAMFSLYKGLESLRSSLT